MKIQAPTLGRLNQGAMFTCATAERYPDCDVLGLVITARCDIAQGKFPVMNYVPVVPFDDWIRVDGFEIARERLSKKMAGELSALFRDWGLAESVLRANSLEIVVNGYLDGLDERSVRRARERGAKIVERQKAFEVVAPGDVKAIADLDERTVHEVVKELMTQKLAGHYYIGAVTPDEAPSCYIALLREATFLPRDLAISIAKGLSCESSEYLRNRQWDRWIKFRTEDDMAMPVGQLPSPYVEHMMQAFSLLFGRIGLPDTKSSHIEEYCRRAGRQDD